MHVMDANDPDNKDFVC